MTLDKDESPILRYTNGSFYYRGVGNMTIWTQLDETQVCELFNSLAMYINDSVKLRYYHDLRAKYRETQQGLLNTPDNEGL